MYGVLEDQYKDNMSRDQALKVTAKSLLASAQRDAAITKSAWLAMSMKDSNYLKKGI